MKGVSDTMSNTQVFLYKNKEKKSIELFNKCCMELKGYYPDDRFTDYLGTKMIRRDGLKIFFRKYPMFKTDLLRAFLDLRPHRSEFVDGMNMDDKLIKLATWIH